MAQPGDVEEDREAEVAGPSGRFAPSVMHAAATLYYLKDATQAEVASSLGVSRATVSRLLAEARRLGIVRIEVVSPTQAPPEELARSVAEALGLQTAWIAPGGHPSVLRAGLAAQLSLALRSAQLVPGDVLLVSSGRTTWDVSHEALTQLPGVLVTPTVGGQHEPEAWYQTNEITRLMAQAIGGHPRFLYAPALPGPGLHERLLQDPGTREVLELWNRARCAVVGVGAPPATRSSLPNFLPRDAEWFATSAGDICTRFIDRDGRELDYPGSERLIATPYETLRALPSCIAVATGASKVPSILAGASAGWFSSLVTDASTASALLESV